MLMYDRSSASGTHTVHLCRHRKGLAAAAGGEDDGIRDVLSASALCT